MICRASEKAAGGKLVRLELEHDGSRILRAKITGDFFLHPEDALGEMEKSIVGMQINAGEPAFSSALAKSKVVFYGVLQSCAQVFNGSPLERDHITDS